MDFLHRAPSIGQALVASVALAALVITPPQAAADTGRAATDLASTTGAGSYSEARIALTGTLAPEPGLTGSSLPMLELGLLARVNADRSAHGLAPVRWDPELLGIARARAVEQLPSERLSHVDLNGEIAAWKMFVAAGTRYHLAGENLARLPGADETAPARAEAALMNSPSHRIHILNEEYDRLSVGAALDAQGRIVFVQLFRATSRAEAARQPSS